MAATQKPITDVALCEGTLRGFRPPAESIVEIWIEGERKSDFVATAQIVTSDAPGPENHGHDALYHRFGSPLGQLVSYGPVIARGDYDINFRIRFNREVDSHALLNVRVRKPTGQVHSRPIRCRLTATRPTIVMRLTTIDVRST